MIKTLLQISFLILFLSSAALAVDVSGAWIIKTKGLEGNEEIEMVIKASGEKLKMTAKGSTLEEMSGSGRLKGDAIKFKLNAKEMPVSIEFKGTVAGDKMSGTRVIQTGGGPGDFGGPDGPGGPPGGPGGMGGPPMFWSDTSQNWTAERK